MCNKDIPESANANESRTQAVSLRFVGWMIAMQLIVALGLVVLVAIVDQRTDNAAQILGAVLSPISGLVGAIIGHHIGSRHV